MAGRTGSVGAAERSRRYGKFEAKEKDSFLFGNKPAIYSNCLAFAQAPGETADSLEER